MPIMMFNVVANADGSFHSSMRYKPWGEVRYSNGSLPTNYTYTGQRSEMGSIGLMYYNARWYDPTIGRFAQADSIVPGGVHGFDRYAYVNNSPLRFTDPNGHSPTICTINGMCGIFNKPGGKSHNTNQYASMTVNLASSIPKNFWDGDNDQAAQYLYLQGHYNLCGHISIEMIYETVTHLYNQLGRIYETKVTGFNEGTNVEELAQIVSMTFPNGWWAYGFVSNYVYGYVAGNPVRQLYAVLKETWHGYDSKYVYNLIFDMLDAGHYVIAGVKQDTHKDARLNPNGVKHWVVVTDITADLITINNPFSNSEETYSWDAFWSAFDYDLVEIIPTIGKYIEN